jgi:hypothetical protein
MINTLTIILALNLSPYSFEITDVKKLSRDYVVELISTQPNTTITLDCSSFIHNLDIKVEQEKFWYYLSENECQAIFTYFHEESKDKRCLIFEEDYLDMDICEDTEKL